MYLVSGTDDVKRILSFCMLFLFPHNECAAQLLKQNQNSVYDVSLIVGFNDRKHFSKEFKKQFGKTPSEFKVAAPDKL